MAQRAELRCRGRFAEIDAVALENTRRVMEAFQDQRVSDSCFAGTSGYGYDDLGRETLDRIYAEVFGTEAALVRIGFVNGTHALTAAMFSLVGPGDTLLSVTGTPYDTLQSAIGLNGGGFGSLSFYGIRYAQLKLSEDGGPDYAAIRLAAAESGVKGVMVQRSRGYVDRRALTIEEIGKICEIVHSVNPHARVMVDNCYGEFTDVREPSHVGADILAGSLIKNPGGGLAPTGGYVAGKAELVERAAARLTTPGIGGECGSTLGNNRLLFQGLFLAPHTVAQALKTAVFCSAMMDELGLESVPGIVDTRSDIIQMVKLRDPEKMKRFCLGIQSGAPVDSFVTPQPAPMPGYDCPIIMAAGAFVQGSSIELSADGPMRDPYTVYMQGALTYIHGKLALKEILRRMPDPVR